jgi:hypothetical protein
LKYLHIIIGESNTRKSSLIRCLTGAGQGFSRKNLEISLGSRKQITAHVIQSALQENYKPKMPKEFVNYVNSINQEHFVFALRVKARGKHPDFSTYIAEFINSGFTISNVALLGTATAGVSIGTTSSVISVSTSASQPTNLTASTVRKAWAWV